MGAMRGPEPRVGGARPFWRRPWILPLAAVTIWVVVHQATPYLDEASAPLMPHDGFPAYWSLLMIHIFAAGVVMLTTIMGVWTALRVRWPAVHRWSGRVYMLFTALGGTAALIILPFGPTSGKLGAAVAVVGWMATSAAGWRAARQRRWVHHRRWMLYSFAFVMQNVAAAVFVKVAVLFVTEPTYLMEGTRWLSPAVVLAVVQWWLYRTADQPIWTVRPVTGPAAPVVQLHRPDPAEPVTQRQLRSAA